LTTLTVVYSLHDNPAFFGVGQGIMGSLFVIGMASIIGLKTKRLGIALTIGILLATLGTLHFANVQATLVLDGDQLMVQNLYSGGYHVRKDDIVSLTEFRRRGGGSALHLTVRSGQKYGIIVAGERQSQLEDILVKDLGLTPEPSSGELKRWSRKS
jgi:hypothetical protein